MMARINKACPLFPAPDVAKAAAWYRDKLGFKIGNVYPDHGYAIVHRDDIEIHFWRCDDRKIAENTSAYFRPDDIDALHATMTGANDGGRISEIEDRAWDMREFYVWDPNGNLLKFGHPTVAEPAREKLRLDEMMDQFERLSPAERRRSIEKAEAFLKATGGRLS